MLRPISMFALVRMVAPDSVVLDVDFDRRIPDAYRANLALALRDLADRIEGKGAADA